MAGPDALKSAVVFVGRLSTRMLVASELKTRGITDFIPCDSPESCLTALAAHASALLILDNEHDERAFVTVLRAAQGRYRIDTRPIYLIAYNIEEKMLSYALEYNILQMHKGDLSRSQIEKNLEEALRYGLRTPFESDIYQMVIKARADGQFDEAYALLQTLWKAEPDNIQAGDELALALCDLNQWDKAEAHLIELVARFPFDTRAKHLLARCFMKRNDYPKARYYLEQASVLSPFNAERLCDLGRVFLDQFQVREAMGAFQDALNLDPDLQDARMGQIQCELLLGEANDVLKILRQMQDHFEFASVFNGAAIVAIRAGHYQQGIGLYKTATGYLVEHPPLMSRVFFNMGLGLWKWGKGKLAVEAFEKAIELDGSNEKAKHNVNQLVVSLGRKPKRDREEGPFSALNSIDTMDDFDELGEESITPSISRS